MEDWLSYRLSDLLLFSPRTYYRLFELHNRAWWPAQLFFLGVGASIVVLLRRGTQWSSTAILVLLSSCWLFVAWAFHLERYATINWAAQYFAAAFVSQALLMLAYAFGQRPLFTRPSGRAGVAALGLVLFALAGWPLLASVVGRAWMQSELFGLTPDPTVVATLGVLATATPRAPRYLVVVPALWCVISGATLWAMESPEALFVALLGLCGLIAAFRARGR
jgi:hypothetical protein